MCTWMGEVRGVWRTQHSRKISQAQAKIRKKITDWEEFRRVLTDSTAIENGGLYNLDGIARLGDV